MRNELKARINHLIGGDSYDENPRDSRSFRYIVRDKKTGENITGNRPEYVLAKNKTEARKTIIESAKSNHDVPRGRRARDFGFVPISDWKIEFIENGRGY